MADNMWRYLVHVRPALAGWRWISLVARYYVNIFRTGNKGLLCYRWHNTVKIQPFPQVDSNV
ncbi:hypothetical protein HER17_17520 [Pectobacterium carotovorum]|uniref:hypothetical protein n=1 Tax=Pectobacterium carotovorum TaxID=554 RepID=UPI0015DF6D5C|nr:hypothetical protein [Pectobacterium carotovorum]QLL94629.1 hypothetical protein HER17_17520 [Pectobacterium carotovorum]